MIYRSLPSDFNYRVEVVSCFCEHRGKILLLHRQDHKPYGNTWGPPAGKVSPGEETATAMVRELEEEAGLKIASPRFKYLDKLFLRYPEYDFIFHVFHLHLKSLPEVKIREEEHKAFCWLPPKKALGLDLIRDEDEVIKIIFGF